MTTVDSRGFTPPSDDASAAVVPELDASRKRFDRTRLFPVVSRRKALLLLVGLTAISLLLGWVVPAVAGTVVILATGFTPSCGHGERTTVLWWTPVALPMVAVLFGVPAAFAGQAGFTPWADAFTARALWLVLVVVAVGLAWIRGGRVRLWNVGSLAAALPAAAALSVAGWKWSQPFDSGAVRFMAFGTDPNNNWSLIYKMFKENIPYATNPQDIGAMGEGVYPRAMHAVAAWLTGMSGQTGTSRGLVETVTAAFLGSEIAVFAAIMMVFGLLAYSAAELLRMPRWAVVTATLGAALMPLNQNWFKIGFATGSWASSATLLLAAAGVLLALNRTRLQSFPVVLWAAGAAVASAHIWQLATPLFAVFAALSGLLWVTASAARKRWGRAAGLVGLAFMAGVMSALPVFAVVKVLGAKQASVAGSFGRLDWVEVVVTVVLFAVAAGVSLRVGGRSARWPWLLWSGAVGGLLLGAALLNWKVTGGFSTFSYYPQRLLWLGYSVAVPAAVAVIVFGVKSLVQCRPVAVLDKLPGGRVLVLGGVAFLGLAAAGGYTLGQGITWANYTFNLEGNLFPATSIAVVLYPVVESLPPNDILVWNLDRRSAVDPSDTFAQSTLTVYGHRYAPQFISRIHDREAACLWLKTYPDAYVITGPDVQFSVDELTEAGCTESIIRPERWIPVEIPQSWFEGTKDALIGNAPIPLPHGPTRREWIELHGIDPADGEAGLDFLNQDLSPVSATVTPSRPTS